MEPCFHHNFPDIFVPALVTAKKYVFFLRIAKKYVGNLCLTTFGLPKEQHYDVFEL